MIGFYLRMSVLKMIHSFLRSGMLVVNDCIG